MLVLEPTIVSEEGPELLMILVTSVGSREREGEKGYTLSFPCSLSHSY